MSVHKSHCDVNPTVTQRYSQTDVFTGVDDHSGPEKISGYYNPFLICISVEEWFVAPILSNSNMDEMRQPNPLPLTLAARGSTLVVRI